MDFQIINGNLLPKEKALIPLTDLGLLRSYSVFEYFRVLEGIPIFIEDHLDRLFRSVSTMQLDLPWTKDEIRTMCHELITANDTQEAGLRIIVTGGYSEDGYTPTRANIYMTLHKPPVYSPHDFTKGRNLITSNFTREVPEVKTTIYVHSIQHQKKMKDMNAIELLYHTDGLITECSRSNIFFVDHNDVLITPANTILHGITRRHVLNIAQEKYTVEERDILLNEIPKMKEAFLTSSTKGVYPIVKIEDTIIGNGKVGNITADLNNSFKKYTSNYLELHENK